MKKQDNEWQKHQRQLIPPGNAARKRGYRDFKPSPEFMEAAKAEFFRNGGKVTKIDIKECEVSQTGYFAHDFLNGG